jgi:hypothetical protein
MKDCLFLDENKTLEFFQTKEYNIFNIESFSDMIKFCKRENRFRFFSIFPDVKQFLEDIYKLDISEKAISDKLRIFLKTKNISLSDIREISFKMFSARPLVNLFFKKPVAGRFSHDFPMKLTSVPEEVEFLHVDRFSADILRIESIPRWARLDRIRTFFFEPRFSVKLPKRLETELSSYAFQLGRGRKSLQEELEGESKVFDEVLPESCK